MFEHQTGQEHELIESMPLLEWFANNYKKFGATLEIVTDKSQEGSQFVKGFGGIGGKITRVTSVCVIQKNVKLRGIKNVKLIVFTFSTPV